MPHLQELVKLHASDPFVLIGVNTGDAPEDYRKGLEKFRVTWLSAFQGEESPIADQFAVEAYPTYLVIDTDGTIRGRGHSGEAMDGIIAELVQKARKAGGE
jgi:hypothetical protein